MHPKEKIGLFFGSFNPIHIAHMIVANSMIEHTEMDKVWLVVTPQSPYKHLHNMLSESDRYQLVKMAISDNDKLSASDIEFHLPRPNYTYSTLEAFLKTYPKKEFSLIIGEDNMNTFSTWKNYQRILNQYMIYVYPRFNAVGHSPEGISHPHIRFIEAPILHISSTYIRETIKNNKSIRYLVPDSVAQLIKLKGFYCT